VRVKFNLPKTKNGVVFSQTLCRGYQTSNMHFYTWIDDTSTSISKAGRTVKTVRRIVGQITTYDDVIGIYHRNLSSFMK
jgi:hypothetical protein